MKQACLFVFGPMIVIAQCDVNAFSAASNQYQVCLNGYSGITDRNTRNMAVCSECIPPYAAAVAGCNMQQAFSATCNSLCGPCMCAGQGLAQCSNNGKPLSSLPAMCADPPAMNCSFYKACLEAAHPCGPTGYALHFGERMCQAYLDSQFSFSANGQLWAEYVRNCLQKKLIPLLSKQLTCAQLEEAAFATHVDCYTKGPISICDLPPKDIKLVLHPAEKSWKSGKQAYHIIRRCNRTQIAHFALQFIESYSDTQLTAFEEMKRRDLFLRFVHAPLKLQFGVDDSQLWMMDMWPGSTNVGFAVLSSTALIDNNSTNNNNNNNNNNTNTNNNSASEIVSTIMKSKDLASLFVAANLTLRSVSRCDELCGPATSGSAGGGATGNGLLFAVLGTMATVFFLF